MNSDLQKTVESRIDDLLPRIGRALWEAQGCEIMLAKYYAIVAKLVGTPAEKEIEAEFEKNFIHTAGRLLGLFKKDVRAEPALVGRLEAFVDERAWLAHKIRRLGFEALKSDEAFHELLQRVEKLSAEARSLIEAFDTLLMDHFVSLGSKRSELERLKREECARVFGS